MGVLTRYPVIALDYAERDKAVPKELLIDYATGNIYVVSATDKTIILDITKKIQDQITNLNISNSTVVITGIGEVNLTDYLNQLTTDLNDTVQATDPASDFSYVIKDTTIDGKSLKLFNGSIEMDGYTTADQLAIAQKSATGLRWMPISEFTAGLTGGGSGYSDVDGSLKNVPVLITDNNKIYPVSHAQKSLNLTGNFANVFLPTTADEYSIIKWDILQLQTDFQLIFEPSVYISKQSLSTDIQVTYTDLAPTVNIIKCTDAQKIHYKFVFETFDNGLTWLLNVTQYNGYNYAG